MKPAAAALLALAMPCLLAMSTPAGMHRTAPVFTQYRSEAQCLAALKRWADSQREEERRSPTVEPDRWSLFEHSSPGKSSFTLTRINVSRFDGVQTAIAYIYEHGCEGARHYAFSDGWESTQYYHEKEE